MTERYIATDTDDHACTLCDGDIHLGDLLYCDRDLGIYGLCSRACIREEIRAGDDNEHAGEWS